MTFNEYQATKEQESIVAFALGLAGETGEVVDDIKKNIFYDKHVPLEHTIEELGDVLWYVANIASELDVALEEIAQANVVKLQARYKDLYKEEKK